MRRMANGNKAAMMAAFREMTMSKEFSHIYDCPSEEKYKINSLLLGQQIEIDYDFD